MIDFQLSYSEKSTQLWFRLKQYMEDKLDQARRRNDASLTEQETATIRGEIRCLKSIIALGDDRPVTGDGGEL